MEATARILRVYREPSGRIPFWDWLQALRDERTRQNIQSRIARVRRGNFGDCKAVGDGVFELRISYGPGFRIYFGQDGAEIVVLLSGGDKSTQDADIKKAKTYWKNYKEEKSYAVC